MPIQYNTACPYISVQSDQSLLFRTTTLRQNKKHSSIFHLKIVIITVFINGTGSLLHTLRNLYK